MGAAKVTTSVTAELSGEVALRGTCKENKIGVSFVP